MGQLQMADLQRLLAELHAALRFTDGSRDVHRLKRSVSVSEGGNAGGGGVDVGADELQASRSADRRGSGPPELPVAVRHVLPLSHLLEERLPTSRYCGGVSRLPGGALVSRLGLLLCVPLQIESALTFIHSNTGFFLNFISFSCSGVSWETNF